MHLSAWIFLSIDMDYTIKKLVSNLEQNPALTLVEFGMVVQSLPFDFPLDYLDYMKECNGGEGVIGEDGRYIRFWPLEELMKANEDYSVSEFAPGLFFIGTDGGGTALGFKKATGAFIEISFIGMSDNDAVERGWTFEEFLVFLSRA
ncbi:SMI1/KNR4 family protein SUKH-1 [Chitinophaga dinghuensis]|uniref:SMI1/KNR4 family protein SUKH-1 n=1 Tax=Chitinophaga dinghuensis TaxID=1539050 RepID=A0A327W4P1_9BACT|nr:SMI1/KNR4 family protein [Chitinophaga dinghuensis]RAJ83330.1 SMI1/KNR4 family protein SUKH-1 [Chitinophaga dinghuensis]